MEKGAIKNLLGLDKEKFILNQNVDFSFTSQKGQIVTSYQVIESTFGPPIDGDCKTSGIWLFENRETKEIFTLYDWKETSLYDQALPSVEEFRKSNCKLTFCIGGRTNCSEFKLWLESKLG